MHTPDNHFGVTKRWISPPREESPKRLVIVATFGWGLRYHYIVRRAEFNDPHGWPIALYTTHICKSYGLLTPFDDVLTPATKRQEGCAPALS